MTCRFVYDIPWDILNPHGTISYNECPYQSYHSELALIEYVRQSKYYTNDYRKASIFLVPNYSACFYNQCLSKAKDSRDNCSQKSEDYMFKILNYIDETKPYWRQLEGRNHVFIFSWDKASGLFKNNPILWTLLRNSIHLTHHATNNSIYFKPKSDVSIPCHRKFEYKQQWVAKTIEAYFRGAILADKSYSSGIRQLLKKYYEGATDILIYNEHNEFYIHELLRSRHALCPPGWAEWSPRIYDAVYSASLPILFEKKWLLPFRDVIEYEQILMTCSVLNLTECIHTQKSYYGKKLRHMLAVRHLLKYNFEGIGATDMIVRSLSTFQIKV